MSTSKSPVSYPYLPVGQHFLYVSASDPFMLAAKEYARAHSLDQVMPTGAVIVKDGKVIGAGANGSNYHDSNGCERVRQNIPTGEGYELCEGCHPRNHAEVKAVADARERGEDTTGAKLFLWGHWWACKSCWSVALEAGISEIVLQDNSEVLFNKLHPDNIVGHQFD